MHCHFIVVYLNEKTNIFHELVNIVIRDVFQINLIMVHTCVIIETS